MAHQHYTGTGKMHSFRGLLANAGEDKIRIQGSVGTIAWRITKFQLMPNTPGDASVDNIVQIWRESGNSQGASGATLDFTNDELLAAAWFSANTTYFSSDSVTIFDNALFVRNIYITNTDNDGSDSINYYIELEEVKVSAAGMAQLAVAAARRTIG